MNMPQQRQAATLKSKKVRYSFFYDYFGPWFLVFFFTLLAPTGIGVFFIAAANLVVRLLAMEARWNGAVGALLLLVFIALIFFVAHVFSQAILQIGRGLDHLLCRFFSLFGIGLNDVLFRGSRNTPTKILYVTFALMFGAEYYFFCYLSNTNSLQQLTDAVAGSGDFQDASLLKIAVAGLAFAYSLFFIALPFAALAVPLWRKMTVRPQVQLYGHENFPGPQCQDRLRVAQISDLHVNTGLDRQQTTSGALNAAANMNVDIIALTGDITDNGGQKEWEQFLAISSVAKMDGRLVLVPGNHDLNTWESSRARFLFTVEPNHTTASNNKAYLYLQAAVSVMGDRSHVVCPTTKGIRTLSEVYRDASTRLDDWVHDRKNGLAPRTFLESLFPMVVESVVNGVEIEVVSVAWNTVKANRWAPLNSIGALDTDQITRGAQLLADPRFKQRPRLHMMHHQLAVPNAAINSRHPKLDFLDNLYAVGMGLEAPHGFLALVKSQHQSCVLHGHHHKYFVGTEDTSGIWIVSAPSSAFGTEASYHPSVLAGDGSPKWLELEFAIHDTNLKLSNVTTH